MNKQTERYTNCLKKFQEKIVPNFSHSNERLDQFWHGFHFIRAMPLLLDHPISTPTSFDIINGKVKDRFIRGDCKDNARFWVDGAYVALGVKPVALTDSSQESAQYKDYFRRDLEKLRTLANRAGLLFNMPGATLYDPVHSAKVLRRISNANAITTPYEVSMMIESLEVERTGRKSIYPAPLLGYPEGLPDLPANRNYFLENQIYGELPEYKTVVQGKFVCRISSVEKGLPHLLKLALASALILDIRDFPPNFVSSSFVWSCDPKIRTLSIDRIKIEASLSIDRRSETWKIIQ